MLLRNSSSLAHKATDNVDEMDTEVRQDTLEDYETSLDQMVAPGIRLWMVLALILASMLVITITVCCIMKLRIPRTKREIEVMAARRKLRSRRNVPASHPLSDKKLESVSAMSAVDNSVAQHNRSNVIVMQSMRPAPVIPIIETSEAEDNAADNVSEAEQSDQDLTISAGDPEDTPTPPPLNAPQGSPRERKDTTV